MPGILGRDNREGTGIGMHGDSGDGQALGADGGAELAAAEITGAESFNVMFAALPRSPTLRHIWRVVYGPDYPEDADPFSFVTLTDLRRIAAELRVGPRQTIVDLACGRGGPGLWIANLTGASLVGVDFSEVAIEQAEQRAVQLGLSGRARFLVRDAAATGLPEASLDGAMSVDSFWLFPDKLRVATEVARILRPGRRFVVTTWEFETSPPGWPPQLTQHRDLLREAGFVVEAYEETTDWRARQLAVYAGILAAQANLTAELGEAAAAQMITEARELPAVLGQSRRVLVVARRQ